MKKKATKKRRPVVRDSIATRRLASQIRGQKWFFRPVKTHELSGPQIYVLHQWFLKFWDSSGEMFDFHGFWNSAFGAAAFHVRPTTMEALCDRHLLWHVALMKRTDKKSVTLYAPTRRGIDLIHRLKGGMVGGRSD